MSIREASHAAHSVAAGTRSLSAFPSFEILAAGALAAFVLVISSHVGAYAGGADSSGYLIGARILAHGDVSVPIRPVSRLSSDTLPTWAYSPLGLRPLGSDALVPTYPIGLPLVVVAMSPLIGLDAAAHATMVSLALAGVLLTMWLARAWGLSRMGSLFAALMLATSPLYLIMSLNLMSDTPALVWLTAAVLLAWHSRRHPLWAGAAGVAFAMAVLTRATNILAIVPIAVCLGISWRRWCWLAIGGLPGAVLLVRFNLSAYGAALTTGYGDYSSLFTVANVALSARNYVDWLPVELTPIGVLALGVPALLRRSPRLTAVLLSWIVPFLVFHSFYFFTHETWWSLRFLLPAFPPMIVGSLLVGRAVLVSAGRRMGEPVSSRVRLLAGWVLVALVLAHNISWDRHFDVLNVGRVERTYVEAAQWARAHLPSDAAILAMQTSGSLFYYTDLAVLRYDNLGSEGIRRVHTAVTARRQPLYAELFPFEVEQRKVFSEYLPGTWTQIGAVKHITFWEYREQADQAVKARASEFHR